MRILWFTNTPSNYNTKKLGYNGGGWISSLENEIKKHDQVELAICFHLNEEQFKVCKNGIIYYPIAIKESKLNNIFSTFSDKYFQKEDDVKLHKYLNVINDFKPDIINIFGTESSFGLISQHVKIPIIVHIQGILTPCLNAYFPPRYSYISHLLEKKNPISIIKQYRILKFWKYRVKREQEILSRIPYFMGRTEWDKRIVSIYSPKSKYFHCNEILRDSFYHTSDKIENSSNKLIITSTISSPLYKGFDTILQAASILKKNLRMDFEWNIFGVNTITQHEKKFKIKAKECNIHIRGIVSANEICQKIQESTIYVHPSYIDNSPNSICEAQMLGCPVIATNVGGIPSLIDNGVDGILIPANDPYQMAYLIKQLFENKELQIRIKKNAKERANSRHDKSTIVNQLLNIYDFIINNSNQ